MCAQKNWEGFKTFNSKLTMTNVFRDYDAADVLEFLKELNENPPHHGINEDKHIKGAHKLYEAFFKNPCGFVRAGVDVGFFTAWLRIYDIDAALGYVSSACPLPSDATAIDTYLPLLVIYCKFMTLLEDKLGEDPPKTACIIVGKPPGSGGRKMITFGATVRARYKDEAQALRLNLLRDAFNNSKEEFPRHDPLISQKYGHCAETYPYICNIEKQREDRFFASQIVGFAVNVENVVSKRPSPFAYNETEDHKRTCMNCESLLYLGNRPPYNCFPHLAQTRPPGTWSRS